MKKISIYRADFVKRDGQSAFEDFITDLQRIGLLSFDLNKDEIDIVELGIEEANIEKY